MQWTNARAIAPAVSKSKDTVHRDIQVYQSETPDPAPQVERTAIAEQRHVDIDTTYKRQTTGRIGGEGFT